MVAASKPRGTSNPKNRGFSVHHMREHQDSQQSPKSSFWGENIHELLIRELAQCQVDTVAFLTPASLKLTEYFEPVLCMILTHLILKVVHEIRHTFPFIDMAMEAQRD